MADTATNHRREAPLTEARSSLPRRKSRQAQGFRYAPGVGKTTPVDVGAGRRPMASMSWSASSKRRTVRDGVAVDGLEVLPRKPVPYRRRTR